LAVHALVSDVRDSVARFAVVTVKSRYFRVLPANIQHRTDRCLQHVFLKHPAIIRINSTPKKKLESMLNICFQSLYGNLGLFYKGFQDIATEGIETSPFSTSPLSTDAFSREN